METVKEKIAYLRGMIDGGDIAKEGNTKLIFQRMSEVLDDLADNVEELLLGQEELEEYMEAIDSDLSDLEDSSCECDHHHHNDDDDELEMVEMECPHCQETVCFEEDFLYDEEVEVSCPECNGVVYSGDEFEEDALDDDFVDILDDDDEEQ